MMRRGGAALFLLAAVAVAQDAAPPALDYGPYDHFLASKETARLRRRATKLVQGLRGLYYTCPTCKGSGEVWVVVRERYYDPVTEMWIPEVKEKQDCSRCKGTRKLFQKSVAERFLQAGLHPDVRRDRRWKGIESSWLQRLEATGVAYRKLPRMRYEVSGPFGTVEGGSSSLWPIRFRLHQVGDEWDWYLYNAEVDGAFGVVPEVAGVHTVSEVLAGDALRLENGTIVRVCGITIPTPDNKIPSGPVAKPDEAARDVLRKLVQGKQVTLTADKYSSATLGGNAIAFVELPREGDEAEPEDVGLRLLAEGVARTHPKHAHMRKASYTKAETEAREAGKGVWAER